MLRDIIKEFNVVDIEHRSLLIPSIFASNLSIWINPADLSLSPPMNPVTQSEIDAIKRRQTVLKNAVESLTREVESLARRSESPLEEHYSPAVPRPIPVLEVPAPVATAAPVAPAKPREPIAQRAPLPSIAPIAPVASTPAATAEPAEKESFEMQVGTVWLVRAGIIILLTGLVFLGNFAYRTWVMPHGPLGKIAMLLLAGGGLFGVGIRLEKKRAELANYARVLVAGGLATTYYTIFAAHFVEKLRVISSPFIGGTLLLAFAGGIVWFANRKRSETIALLAVLLSYYTSAINPIGSFTLFSSLILTAAAVYFVIRHGWVKLTTASLFATYASYGYWHIYHGGGLDRPWVGTGFLAGYWLLFTTAVFAIRTLPVASRLSFATVNNAAFFTLASLSFLANRSGYWAFTLGYGLVLIAAGIIARRRESPVLMLDAAYFTQGAIVATAGLVMKLTGPQMAIVLAVESVLLDTLKAPHHPRLARIAIWATGIGSALFAFIALIDQTPHSLGVALTVAIAHTFSAWLSKRRAGLPSPATLCTMGTFRITIATALGLLATFVHASAPNQPYILAIAALLCAASVYALAIAELPYASVVVLAAAFATTAVHPFAVGPFTLIIATGLALAIWWQHQKKVAAPAATVQLASLANAALATGAAILWMTTRNSTPALQTIAPAATLAFVLVGIAARTPGITTAGLAPMLLAAFAFLTQLDHSGSWLPPLAVPAAFAILAALTLRFRERVLFVPDAETLAKFHTTSAIASTVIWALVYIPEAWRPVFFAATGCTMLAASIRFPRVSLGGAVLTAFALALTWFYDAQIHSAAAIVLAIVGVEIVRFSGERASSGKFIAALPWAVAASGWQLATRMTWEHHRAWLTIAWALYAFAILVLGIARREAIYRRSGLGIIALAVASVFLVDVWRLGTVERIAAFIVLGLVLITLGFFYNRFRDIIRKWL
jgi:uncharacterized membrane protein